MRIRTYTLVLAAIFMALTAPLAEAKKGASTGGHIAKAAKHHQFKAAPMKVAKQATKAGT